MSFTRTKSGLFVPKRLGIIHRDRWLDAQDPIVTKFGISGHFVVELIEASTGRVKRKLEFDNLITDAGLNGIGNVDKVINLTNWAACGTGSTAPANSDTALVAEVSPGRTNLVGGGAEAAAYTAGPPDYYEKSRVREFSTSQANGNLTEIGFFSASAAGTMFCRQLFKDGTGTPTTVVKTSSDILRVTYKLRIHPPQTDGTSSITISGTSYTWTLRALGVSSTLYWGTNLGGSGLLEELGSWSVGRAAQAVEANALVARTATALSSPLSAANATTAAAYTVGNFYRDLTYVWPTGAGNFGTGLGGIELDVGSAGRAFQEVFSPKFTKDATKQLTLVHRVSWARYP